MSGPALTSHPQCRFRDFHYHGGPIDSRLLPLHVENAAPGIEHRYRCLDKLAHVAGHNHQVFQRRDGSDEQVGLPEGVTALLPFDHHCLPAHYHVLVHGENPTSKQGTHGAVEPVKISAAPQVRQLLYAKSDLAACYLGREQELAGLRGNKLGDPRVWLRLAQFRQDVGVEQPTSHRSTSRTGDLTVSRPKFTSASGDDFRAATISLPETGRCMRSKSRRLRLDCVIAMQFRTLRGRRTCVAHNFTEASFGVLQTPPVSCPLPSPLRVYPFGLLVDLAGLCSKYLFGNRNDQQGKTWMAGTSPRLSGSVFVDKAHGVDSSGFRALRTRSRTRKGTHAMLHQNSVFHGVLKYVPWHQLDQSVEKHGADDLSRKLNTKRHVDCVAVWPAQRCASLREIVTGHGEPRDAALSPGRGAGEALDVVGRQCQAAVASVRRVVRMR